VGEDEGLELGGFRFYFLWGTGGVGGSRLCWWDRAEIEEDSLEETQWGWC
jgi:hypothetical protein